MFEFLIFVFVLPFVFAEEIPDYDNPYAPIFFDKPVYTWTDKIKITIVAPSWNTDKNLIDSIGNNDDNPVNISTRSHSLDSYKLTETDVKSGIFTGEVILSGFLHDVDGDGDFDTTPRTIGNGPTSGFLEINRDEAITVYFEFADGVVLSESVPVSWNKGTIQFTKDIFSSDDTVSIRVIDSDMNLNPEALDHMIIEIFSDSDVGGIKVNAIETSESSGLFVATISLSQTSSSSGNRLYALPGDKLFGKYDDYTLPKPYSLSDILEIETFATINSSVIPVERLDNSPIVFSDSLGNPLLTFSTNNQMQIVGTITNQLDYKQKFIYFFQVKNSDNHVESVSWIQGELSSKQSLDVSQSWIPKKSGTYTVETFVWNSFSDLVALGPITSTLIMVE